VSEDQGYPAGCAKCAELGVEIDRLKYRIKALTNPYQLGYKEGDTHGRKDTLAEVRRIVEQVELEVRKYDTFPTTATGMILARLEQSK
jgi:hypothetical protein